MKEEKISVIMPTYNTEKYIEKAINSVLNQKYQNYELIIIDDCSTDDTKLICEKYAHKNDNITFIEKEKNSGVSNSRNIRN